MPEQEFKPALMSELPGAPWAIAENVTGPNNIIEYRVTEQDLFKFSHALADAGVKGFVIHGRVGEKPAILKTSANLARSVYKNKPDDYELSRLAAEYWLGREIKNKNLNLKTPEVYGICFAQLERYKPKVPFIAQQEIIGQKLGSIDSVQNVRYFLGKFFNSIDEFVEVSRKLEIDHNDLHDENIIWDDTNFWIIDFGEATISRLGQATKPKLLKSKTKTSARLVAERTMLQDGDFIPTSIVSDKASFKDHTLCVIARIIRNGGFKASEEGLVAEMTKCFVFGDLGNLNGVVWDRAHAFISKVT